VETSALKFVLGSGTCGYKSRTKSNMRTYFNSGCEFIWAPISLTRSSHQGETNAL